ncbi:hypothetical protein GQ457_17G006600 [Hibiscus cannabinus]
MLNQDNVIDKLPTPHVYEETGGQPPDGNPVLPLPPSLERSPSPTPLEGENGSKRVRNNAYGYGQFDTVAMETEMNFNDTRDVGEISLLQEMDVADVPKQSDASTGVVDATYASKVRSNGMNNSRDKNTTDFFDQEIKILVDDIILNTSGSIPSIQFSNRVHDQVDHNIRNSIIVRLLGRSIGFKTLQSHILMLWKPTGTVQLIDLENNYFVARFSVEKDYIKVLSEGPWMIFGSYLTVQPWSRQFSTLEKYPSQTYCSTARESCTRGL